MKEGFRKIGRFYVDGFKGMTWGRPLWILIILKVFILFAVFRLFFFKPVLGGKTDAEKSDYVGTMLTAPNQADSTGPTISEDLPYYRIQKLYYGQQAVIPGVPRNLH